MYIQFTSPYPEISILNVHSSQKSSFSEKYHPWPSTNNSVSYLMENKNLLQFLTKKNYKYLSPKSQFILPFWYKAWVYSSDINPLLNSFHLFSCAHFTCLMIPHCWCLSSSSSVVVPFHPYDKLFKSNNIAHQPHYILLYLMKNILKLVFVLSIPIILLHMSQLDPISASPYLQKGTH